MIQTGLMREIALKWLSNGPGDMSHRLFIEEAPALGYDNLFLPANLLFGGMACALVLGIIEKTSKKLLTSTNKSSASKGIKVFVHPAY